MTLKDKRIAALGGTSGIGLAVAQAALEEGASVVVASRKQADVDSAQAKLALQSPSRIAAQVVDVTSEENLVSITLYNGMLYGALWEFQPLGTGTAILVATTATALILRLPAARFLECIIQTWRQTRATLLTVMSMVGLAYLMNYSGLNYTIGKGVASLGSLFVVLAPFLGWLAVALSGTDAAGNALFGNLQVIAARQLSLDPVLFAATNSSGGVLGKMISAQNIATGCSVTELCANEGAVFTRTVPHSIALTAMLGALVAAQQFLVPWIIPH